MRYLIGLILAGALFAASAVPVLAGPKADPPGKVWYPPPAVCERIDTARDNPQVAKWLTHLPFTTIDCSGDGTPQPDD